MFYAGENKISQEPFDGAIEISQEQYQEALEGILIGKVVSIENGFSVGFLPEPESEPEPEMTDEDNDLEDIKPTPADVDAERARRVSDGFYFEGVYYQARPEDRENITGASVAALAALSAGAQPNDLRWHGGDTDFTWIAEDNSLTPMDAQTMFAFGQAAMAHKQSLIFAARALKDLPEIPEDFRDDKYWIL